MATTTTPERQLRIAQSTIVMQQQGPRQMERYLHSEELRQQLAAEAERNGTSEGWEKAMLQGTLFIARLLESQGPEAFRRHGTAYPKAVEHDKTATYKVRIPVVITLRPEGGDWTVEVAATEPSVPRYKQIMGPARVHDGPELDLSYDDE